MSQFYKAEVYYNTGLERLFIERTTLPIFRPGLLANAPPAEREEILKTPLSMLSFLAMHVRMFIFDRPVNGPYKYLRIARDYLENRIEEGYGPEDRGLRQLSDEDLWAEFEHWRAKENKFNSDLTSGWFIYARDMLGLLGILLEKWYDGDNPMIFTELLTGLPQRSATSEENFTLWRLSEKIRASSVLSETFASSGLNYLDAFRTIPEGRDFLDDYQGFLANNAHRGHPDRDLYFKRRAEDVSIDYQNFRLMLASSSTVNPEEREKQVNERRRTVVIDVETRLRRQPFGSLRLWIFRRLLNYAYNFFLLRDDQRHFFDRYSYAMKRCIVEIGRRLQDRGILQQHDDVFFLGRDALFALLDHAPCDPLLAAKISARRRDFDRMEKKEAKPPPYLRRNKPVSFRLGGDDPERGALLGVGTSRGTVTARARVVKELRDIGQVTEGDILVTQSTDPGWTPVFNLINGIVLETGGLLAHGSCLAREYGLPAIQLAGATETIPDRAIITVNGDTGEVVICEA